MIIALYILFSVVSFLRRDYIRFYEVREGSLVRENQYNGIILREETAYPAAQSGYVHFTVPEGRKIAKNAELYTIDESGKLEKYLEEHPELQQNLTEKQVLELKNRLENFSQSFQDNQFNTLYSFPSSLSGDSLAFSGEDGMKQLNSILATLGIQYIVEKAPEAGTVSYLLDGYEGFKEEEISADTFRNQKSKKTITKGGDHVEEGKSLYKIIRSSDWEILFSLTEEERKEMENRHKVTLVFSDQDLELPAELYFIHGKDGKIYGKVKIQNYDDYFLEDRFLSFALKEKEESCLKIPASSVVKKEFYVIPNEFLLTEKDGSQGFKRKGENGTVQYVPTEIYRKDQQFSYVSIPKTGEENAIKTGDLIVKDGSTDSYTVGPTKLLEGVYNINKGYAVFRQIVALEKNDEYVIVEKNTPSGIEVYDHIVLEGSMVRDGQLIFQ